jgi:predicted RNA-binding protein with TRAM domain
MILQKIIIIMSALLSRVHGFATFRTRMFNPRLNVENVVAAYNIPAWSSTNSPQTRLFSSNNKAKSNKRSKKSNTNILPRGEGPFEYHQEIVIKIDNLTNLGDGIAHVNVPSQNDPNVTSKFVVMVPYVMPGSILFSFFLSFFLLSFLTRYTLTHRKIVLPPFNSF